MNAQLDLFSVLHAYASPERTAVPNAEMYSRVAEACGLDPSALQARHPVGQAAAPHNLVARRLRWYQQTLKLAGLIERVDGERGLWRLVHRVNDELQSINPGVATLGYSTELGVALLGSCDHVFQSLNAPIALYLSSPPYPLAQPRQYGNVPEAAYVDWLLRMLEPVVRNLAPGGSICLNVGNDVFERGLPSRSLYRERLLIALHDRLGLHKMDELVWHNPSKPPGPLQWASRTRQQLNVAWEPVYWLTNDPSRVRADNRRVLQAHTDKHMALMAQGGEQRTTVTSDGAYRIRPGAYGAPTAGRIPRNVLTFGHACGSQQAYKREARAAGLPAHGAPLPLALAKFLISFLTEPGDLVADGMAGSNTVGLAAEELGRRWVASDRILEYVVGSALRFRHVPSYTSHLAAA